MFVQKTLTLNLPVQSTEIGTFRGSMSKKGGVNSHVKVLVVSLLNMQKTLFT